MKIYVASSWRNLAQPTVVRDLVKSGHSVYDFRNPAPGNNGFAWSSIDPNWKNWTPEEYIEALNHPAAIDGYYNDFDAMREADAVVLVLPCGRSAHLELGWAVGAGKITAILMLGDNEPELMAKMVNLITPSIDVLVDWLSTL